MPSELGAACRSVLCENWRTGSREGVAYAYTCPSPRRYPWQWYWDSCFHAIAWRRHDPARAEAELRTLLAAARPDGHIGHTIFWHAPVSRARAGFYNVAGRRSAATGTIQPPLLAWAWRVAVGDPVAVPAIGRHYDWLAARRTLDPDGLIWIVQPDESGLDASPKFDPVWGRRAHAHPGFGLLVRRNRRLGFDLRRVVAAGGPVVCEVLVNVLHCLSLVALGRPSTTPAIVERLYDPGRGLFLDEVRPGGERPAVATWAALAPLALPDLPEEIGRRLVEEHLLDRDAFWSPVMPASVSMREPSFRAGDAPGPFRRYWRGPAWINAAWLLWLGLRRLGYADAAADMAATIEATVLREGLREYYDARSGGGLGARDFAWSTLALEMADPDPAAATSHL